jgi:hypothetical protein
MSCVVSKRGRMGVPADIREPPHGYPIRDRSGVTVGWGWTDGVHHYARDDRWEVESSHAGPLGRETARLSCLARAMTDEMRIAVHIPEIVEILSEAAVIAEEAEQIKSRPMTVSSCARIELLLERIKQLTDRRHEIDRLCKAVPS